MATFDYDGLKGEALALLKEFGKPITLTRENDGQTYDPITGSYPASAPTSISGTGVLTSFNNREINNDTIKATDRKLIFQGDELSINDKYNSYRVYSINNIDPAETGPIVSIVQLRR